MTMVRVTGSLGSPTSKISLYVIYDVYLVKLPIPLSFSAGLYHGAHGQLIYLSLINFRISFGFLRFPYLVFFSFFYSRGSVAI